jgi:hypothetical protein
MSNFKIKFRPSGRGKAQCASHPDYPNGIALDGTEDDEPACTAILPYPAPECGTWDVHCNLCLMNILITAAGRADDPISVKMPCNITLRKQ